MMRLIRLLYNETSKTIKNPGRILGIFNKEKLDGYYYSLKLRFQVWEPWNKYGRLFRRKVYRTYESYIIQQRSKLRHIDLSGYDVRYREALRERLKRLDFLRSGMAVLCLAARIGTEVKSFLDIGYFAIGIDINPGKNNRYVLQGDFHDIQFPSGSFDVVFTNSLDHTFDIEKLINEVKRALRKKGILIIEAQRGFEEAKPPGLYESFFWPKVDDIVCLFKSSQFRLIRRLAFEYPYDGEQLCFEKET